MSQSRETAGQVLIAYGHKVSRGQDGEVVAEGRGEHTSWQTEMWQENPELCLRELMTYLSLGAGEFDVVRGDFQVKLANGLTWHLQDVRVDEQSAPYGTHLPIEDARGPVLLWPANKWGANPLADLENMLLAASAASRDMPLENWHEFSTRDVPRPVDQVVRHHLQLLKEQHQALDGIERVRGNGHVLATEVTDRGGDIDYSFERLSEVRNACVKNQALGDFISLVHEVGLPDFQRFGYQAPEWATDSRAGMKAAASPSSPLICSFLEKKFASLQSDLGGCDGFYRVNPGKGVYLYGTDRNVQAYVVNNPEQGRFVVTAHQRNDGIWHMQGLGTDTAEWLAPGHIHSSQIADGIQRMRFSPAAPEAQLSKAQDTGPTP